MRKRRLLRRANVSHLVEFVPVYVALKRLGLFVFLQGWDNSSLAGTHLYAWARLFKAWITLSTG